MASDFISLAPMLIVRNSRIYDPIVGACHVMRPHTATLLQLLQTGATFKDISQKARSLGINERQLNEMLGLLNIIGGLQRKRLFKDVLGGTMIQTRYLLLGILFAPLYWRKDATCANIIIGTLKAVWPVIILTIGVGAVIGAASFAAPITAFFGTIFALGILVSSLLFHEYAHLYLIKRFGRQANVLQARLRLGIIHAHLAPSQDIASAITGPMAGFAIALIVSVCAYMLQEAVYALMALLTALFHISSLLPWYGDGLSLYKSLKELGSMR